MIRLLLGLSFLTLSFYSQNLNASDYQFEYSCKTAGTWTQSALEQAGKLLNVIERLRENENCSGVESFLIELTNAQNSLQEMANNEEVIKSQATEQQKSYVNSIINTDMNAIGVNPASVLNLAAGLHMDSAIEQMAGFAGRMQKSFIDPMKINSQSPVYTQQMNDIVNSAMSVLPKLETCLVNAPNQAIAAVSAILRLSSNILTSGAADGASKLSNVIANVVSFLRNSKFARVTRQLNQNELWGSISCALESTTQSYCSAKDSIKLLNWSIAEMQPEQSAEAANNITSQHPIAGYYVLIRNVPTITEWLLKVQFGVNPKLVTDSEFKNNVWKTTTAMIESTNLLLGRLNEARLTVNLLADDVAKKSELFKLIMGLSDTMKSAVFTSGSSMINFFTTSMPANLLPLYLIGIDIKDVPPEVKPNAEGKFVMPVDGWIQNMGDYRPMFNDPTMLLDTVENRLTILIQSSLKETSKFFIQRLIVDKPNLVGEAYVHNSLHTSVVNSLYFVSEYLVQLRDRIERSKFGHFQMLPIIDDTRTKIDGILKAFDTVLTPDAIKDSTTTEQARIIIETVYDNFNVLLQRDSFLTNRMATLVFYDYYLQIAEGVNFGDYEEDLLIVSNNEMIKRMIHVHQTEPAVNREDFQTAMALNRRNLDALEDLFRDNFFEFLQTMDDESVGRPIWRQNVRVLRRVNENVPWYIRYTPLAYIYQLGDYFFGNSYKYRIETNNPFNPRYVRRDNDHGSFVNLRNRVCIQLLAFQRPGIFNEFCSKAMLASPFYINGKKAKHLEYLNIHFKNYSKIDQSKTSDQRICAYRDYLRRNNVYWLTLQRERAQKSRVNRVINSNPTSGNNTY